MITKVYFLLPDGGLVGGLAGGLGGGAANLVDLRGPAGGGVGLLARAPGPAFHAGFGLFGVAPAFLGCDGPGVAFLGRDGPGVAFLAGDLPRELAFCTGRELLNPVGVVFRVSGLPREGGGALPALWRPGPAFDAGFGDGVRPGNLVCEKYQAQTVRRAVRQT